MNSMEETKLSIAQMCESFASEKEYRDSNCMHYSLAKDVYWNPNLLIEKIEEKKEDWFTLGTLVDMLITKSALYINDNVIINDTVPSDQFKLIAEYIINLNIDINKITDEEVEAAFNFSGSKVNWGIAVKKSKIIENCSSYINLLKSSKDKLIVTTDMFNEATQLANTITTHEFTKELFNTEGSIELLYQYKIKFIYEDIVCKSMIDILRIDHDNKVISPYDIKTGSDLPWYFAKSTIIRFKYFYQAALYLEGLKAFFKAIPLFKDYIIDEFRFVYVSRLKPTYPIIVKIPVRLHREIVSNGIITDSLEYPSLKEIFEAIKYHISVIGTNDFDDCPLYIKEKFGEVDFELPYSY